MNCMSYTASKFHLILCLSLAVYTVHLQLKSFNDNKDTSSVLYKSIIAEENDVYPTWSVCFQFWYGKSFTLDSGSGGQQEITSYMYWKMLMGEANITSNFSGVEYDESITNFMGWLVGAQFDGKDIWSSDSDNVSSIPFDVAYQDPDRKCFTKKDGIKVGKKRNYDRIALNLYSVVYEPVFIQYYFHQAGQLIKQLAVEFVYELDQSEGLNLIQIYQEKEYTPQKEIQVTQVEILNKRPGANIPCDPDLVNEDMTIIREIIMLVGCIPAYWKRFAALDGSLKYHVPCDEKEQFKKLSSFLPKYGTGNYFAEKTQHLYMQPCKETKAVVRSESTKLVSPRPYVSPTVTYVTEVYKSITNEQAFSSHDLWSQIGGCIGIFLGYSLLQVTQ